MSYENPPHYDVEATFEKRAGAVISTVRVTHNIDGAPIQTIVTRYSLVDGDWQDKVIQDSQRS